METPQLIRVPTVAMMLSVSRSTVWRWTQSKPDFPKPIKISAGITVWRLNEIQRWLDGQK